MIDADLFKTARCIILYLDADARIVNFNPYMEVICGYRIDDVKGKNWFDVFIPEVEKDRITSVFNESRSGLNTDGTISQIITADGSLRTVIWSNTRQLDQNGNVSDLLCCGQDITDRQISQDHLDIRTQQLFSLSDIAYQALQEPRFEKLITYILNYVLNSFDAARAIYLEQTEEGDMFEAYATDNSSHTIFHRMNIPVLPGSLTAQVLQTNQTILIPDFQDDRRFIKHTEIDEDRYNSCMATPSGTGEITIGVLSVYLDSKHEFTDEEVNYLQSIANLICIVVERNRNQARAMLLAQELARLSRVKLVGEMGAHIAHELNQPLTALSNYLQGCRNIIHSSFDDVPEPIAMLMNKTLNEAERAAAIIKHIRDYIETGRLNITTESINQVIEETCNLVTHELSKKKITLSLDLDMDIPTSAFDKLQIQQVLVNVIQNSIEAMQTVVNKQLLICSTTNGRFIEIAVQDTGIGQVPDLRATIFKFIPGRENGKIGIGLSICKSIIDDHGGTCRFTRGSNGETRFCFTLPLTIDTAQDA